VGEEQAAAESDLLKSVSAVSAKVVYRLLWQLDVLAEARTVKDKHRVYCIEDHSNAVA